MADRKLVKRSDKVSFLGCLKDGSEKFNRMRGFTTLSGSKNPSEYSKEVHSIITKYFGKGK